MLLPKANSVSERAIKLSDIIVATMITNSTTNIATPGLEFLVAILCAGAGGRVAAANPKDLGMAAPLLEFRHPQAALEAATPK